MSKKKENANSNEFKCCPIFPELIKKKPRIKKRYVKNQNKEKISKIKDSKKNKNRKIE